MAVNASSRLFDLSGKVALVTGASGYLGQAMAAGLAEAGARVVASSRSRARAEAAARELPSSTCVPHLAVELNHLEERSIHDGFAAAVAAAGSIDILINNGHQPTGRSWRDDTYAEFTHQLTNAAGYFLLARLLRDHVVKRGVPGSVVLLGSMYGVVSSDPKLYFGVCPDNPASYQALKGGVVQLGRHLAVQWASDNVRVNVLSPGPFPNPMSAPPELVHRLAEKCPMGRVGMPDELKGAVVFLASAASSFFTGQNLIVDGGWTAC